MTQNFKIGQTVFGHAEDWMDDTNAYADLDDVAANYRRLDQEGCNPNGDVIDTDGEKTIFALVREQRIAAMIAVEVDDETIRITHGALNDDLEWFVATERHLDFVAETSDLLEALKLRHRGRFVLYGLSSTLPSNVHKALYKFADDKLTRVTSKDDIKEGKKYFREIHRGPVLNELASGRFKSYAP